MSNSIKQELKLHVLNLINDGVLTDDNVDDWHHVAFNEKPYMPGYCHAEKWLEKHGVNASEAVATVINFERELFGEVQLRASDVNARKAVSLYVYSLGEELLAEANAGNIAELKAFCEAE